MLLAGIDIGTLTCRLLIAHVDSVGRLEPIHSDRRILRLGEGVGRERRLNPEAMARVVDTLREWQQVIRSYHVDASVVVGTSAVRDARNSHEFLAEIQKETGMTVEVLSGREEATRTLLGMRSGLPSSVESFLGLDIGGGSTEFILHRERESPKVASLDLGVVRLTEQVFHSDPPTPAEVATAERLIDKATKHAILTIGETNSVTLIGTAGTITTLSAMAQGLTTYDPIRIHNFTLSLSTIQEMEENLFSHTKEARKGLSGLEPGREEVILAGTLILRCIMQHLGFDTCLVSEYGLREGMLVDRSWHDCTA